MQFTNVAVGRITQPGMPHMARSPRWTTCGGGTLITAVHSI